MAHFRSTATTRHQQEKNAGSSTSSTTTTPKIKSSISNNQKDKQMCQSWSLFWRIFAGLCLAMGLCVLIQFFTVVNLTNTGITTTTTTTSSSTTNENNHHHNTSYHKNTSAACLLVMDDNHRLVEWIAYHYFTVNLRHLIVAVDPRSTTSPLSILQRWLDFDWQFQFQIWNDDDYMGARVHDKRQQLSTLKRKDLTMVHRVRQKAFYQACLEHLDATRRNNSNDGWILLLDVDEYLVINRDLLLATLSNQDSPSFTIRQTHDQIMSTPGGLLQFVQDTVQQVATSMSMTAESSPALSSNPIYYQQFTSPCISLPRLLFGTQQDNTTRGAARNNTVLPSNANIHLDTLRWFYHAHYHEFDRNGLAKTMLDLSRIAIPKPHFTHPVNPHRPFQDFCSDPKRIDLHKYSVLRVYHYLSTWETYSFRNDSRKGGERSREAWEFRALSGADRTPETYTDDIVPWLQGFVQHMGMSTAVQLLEGAGLPLEYTHPPHVNDQWKFLFVQDFLNANKQPQYESKFGQFLQQRTKHQTQP